MLGVAFRGKRAMYLYQTRSTMFIIHLCGYKTANIFSTKMFFFGNFRPRIRKELKELGLKTLWDPASKGLKKPWNLVASKGLILRTTQLLG